MIGLIVYMEDWLANMLLWGFISSIMAAIAVSVAWGIHSWLTPKEAKIVRKATRQKKKLLILEGDGGVTDFLIGAKEGPEGILETPKMGKPKRRWTGIVGRNVPETPVTTNTDLLNLNASEKEAYKKITELLAGSATHKTHLRHARIPVLFGYKGKAPLTRIAQLANLKTIKKVAEFFPKAIGTVDLTTIKSLFSMPWDSTQLAAQAELKYMEGFAEGKKASDKSGITKILLLMVMVFGLIAATALILKFV